MITNNLKSQCRQPSKRKVTVFMCVIAHGVMNAYREVDVKFRIFLVSPLNLIGYSTALSSLFNTRKISAGSL
jgi:hypothetical protein